VREALHDQVALAAGHDLDGFVAAMRDRVLASAPDRVRTYDLAAPLDQQFAGLDRWHAKRAGRG
jgi:hypothetical protein